MSNDFTDRKNLIDDMKCLAEDMGRRGDRFSAEIIFNAAELCSKLVADIKELEIRDRVDHEFIKIHLVEYEKLRIAIIGIRARIQDLGIEKDPEIVKAFSNAGIMI
jgi:hypothetical protein